MVLAASGLAAASAAGAAPRGLALTGSTVPVTAYVANRFDSTVTPVRAATNTALKPVKVGNLPSAIAITPDGKTAYVTNSGSESV